MNSEQAMEKARRIARGHAYARHVAEGDDFPEIKSRDDFAALIHQVLTDPGSTANNSGMVVRHSGANAIALLSSSTG